MFPGTMGDPGVIGTTATRSEVTHGNERMCATSFSMYSLLQCVCLMPFRKAAA